MEKWMRDARPVLVASLLLGMVVWRASPFVLGGLLCVLGFFFIQHDLARRAAPGTLRRTLVFVLFWPLLRFVVESVSLIWSAQPWFGASRFTVIAPALAQPAWESLLLALRLSVLMGMGLTLSLALSPRALGLGFAWLFRPLLRQKAWMTALALTLMVQSLPRAHFALAHMRTAAKARGLPFSGWRYYRLALPQLVRLLARQPYQQAVALMVRRLHSADSWRSGA